ncbi:hypothetical protein [Haliangium ochraceum]|uniref:Uncharacterized protein n=1 Tax=Haliangium ochraceum (strain DSM 14365 / JCM 11303 / SMP-2) TaxID=502025 RepID=D0LP97_HALO1|nr:hypothetical protein [Haliangium ochraceum]ACY13462.1 conserved hypothetical protein [Haliangium ochraceum DSM 14365]
MSEITTCPSGLTGRVRGMKVREERILADRKLAKSGGQLDALLGACWEETLDAGPYDIAADGLDWGQVLQGDRFYALLQIRVQTYGADYAFATHCQAGGCRARFEWELDLTELPCRKLSEASRQALDAGNRFETTLPGAGVRVWFRLLTGADERKLSQLRQNAGERLLSALLAFRVREVEGVEAGDKKRFLEDLSLRDADFLVGEFDRVDCGVDTRIEVECPTCLATQDLDLPFDHSFFLPGAQRRNARTSKPAPAGSFHP